jgi:hypothetical protein
MKTDQRPTVLLLYVHEEHAGNWCYVDAFVGALVNGGFEVVVVSSGRNPAPNGGFTTAPHVFYELDFSKPDRDDRLIAIAQKHGVQFAHSLGDWAANGIARMNAALGLPGFTLQAFRTLVNKDLAYEFSVANGIRMPKSKVIRSEADFDDSELQVPVIIKPTYGTGMYQVEEYDYQIYPTLAEFRAALTAQGELETFLATNRKPGFFGSHMVQKYVLQEKFVMVNFAYIQGKTEILQIGRHYYPAPYVIKPYAVGTPEIISEKLRAEILRIIETYRTKLGIDNSFASIQFLVDEDEIPYPIDIHLRLGEAKGMLLATFEAEVLAQAVRGMIGLPYELKREGARYSLKYSFLLTPGKFDEIEFPRTDSRLQLCNLSELCDPKEVPSDPSFESLGSYFILTTTGEEGASLKERCWEEARKFLAETRVHYTGANT